MRKLSKLLNYELPDERTIWTRQRDSGSGFSDFVEGASLIGLLKKDSKFYFSSEKFFGLMTTLYFSSIVVATELYLRSL
ncbi:hypothetical protein J4474_04810 [Candidatus Pacearchaeota archaeon]|nr:hypothetical protein [Candidatus Pacearchaeota archaeon]